MDLWQLFCYIDGNEQRKIERLKDYNYLAVQIGKQTGQYFSGKKAPDVRVELDRLDNCILKIYDNNSSEEKVSDEQQIKTLKKQLKYFK